MVQLGAFRQASNAAVLVAALAAHGYQGVVVPSGTGGRGWQFVRLVGFPDREEAVRVAADVQRQTGIRGLVMRAGP